MSETDVQLVERLRRYVALCEATDAGKSRMAENQRDAADAIERLTAEREKERAAWEQQCDCENKARVQAEELCALAEGATEEMRKRTVAAEDSRDAQVREAFMAGWFGLRRTDGRWVFPVADDITLAAVEAFAAFQARPSSGTGSGEKEQA